LDPSKKLGFRENHHPKIWRDEAKSRLLGAPTVGVIGWYEHLNSNFDELLEAKCGQT